VPAREVWCRTVTASNRSTRTCTCPSAGPTRVVACSASQASGLKCNRQKLTEFPALGAYARDLFQTPGFGDTIDFPQKEHYYVVHKDINPTQVIPCGPDPSNWLMEHGRDELSDRPFGDGTPRVRRLPTKRCRRTTVREAFRTGAARGVRPPSGSGWSPS
jgi:hypothetical protein